MSVTLTVPGVPVPKGRPRMTREGHTYTPKRTREYEETVGWAWRSLQPCPEPFAGDVAVSIDVYEGGRAADVDNYAKAILDALNTLAWADDRQVVDVAARVHRKAAEPRVVVTVTEVAG